MRDAETVLGIIQERGKMAARQRKTLVTCRRCHADIHAGRVA